MSQSGTLDRAWGRRRRRLGDSVPGCLLFIALVLGGSIWGYFKFVHWRDLVNADTRYKTFVEKKNWAAYLEYGRRFRQHYDVSTSMMTKQCHDIVKRYEKGEYKGNAEQLQREIQEYKNALLESIQEFNGQEVPQTLEKPHKQIAAAHRLCYESMLELEAAAATEGAESTTYAKNARKKCNEAYKMQAAGKALFYQLWKPA